MSCACFIRAFLLVVLFTEITGDTNMFRCDTGIQNGTPCFYNFSDPSYDDVQKPVIKHTNLNESTWHVLAGELVQLEAFVYGIPMPTIIWYKDDKPIQIRQNDTRIILSEKNQTLLITYTITADEGAYSWIATNKGGNASTKILLLITAKKISMLEIKANGSYNLVGDNATLNCSFTISTGRIFYLKWKLPNNELESITKKIVIKEHYTQRKILYRALTIRKLTKNDEGPYTCEVWDEDFNTESFTYYLHVNDTFLAIIVQNESRNLTVRAGESKITFAVNVTAFPRAGIAWYNPDGDGIVSSRGSKYFAYNDGQISKLEIKYIDIKDSGTYQIMAFNNHQQNSANLTLTVEGEPVIELQERENFYQYQKTYPIECLIIANPLPNVTWLAKTCDNFTNCSHIQYKNIPQKNFNMEDQYKETVITQYQIKSIYKYTAVESLWVQCKAENIIGSSNSQSLYLVTDLDVVDKDGFAANISSNLITVGGNIEMTCGASKYWYQNNITWYLNKSDDMAPAKVLPDMPTNMPTSTGIASVTVIIFLAVFSVIATVAAFVIFHLLKKKKRLARTLEDDFIKLVKIEKPMIINDSLELVLPNIKIEYQPKSNLSSMWEYQLVGDKNWEFPRKNIRFEETIGQGEFGAIAKAQAYEIIEKNVTTLVAIKMLKAKHNDIHMINLVIEMEVMKMIGKHKNILNLLGCCTQGGPLLIIMEYVSRGNLKDFLNKFKSLPVNISAEKINYERENSLSEKTLVSFALQIATGMEYLVSKRVCITSTYCPSGKMKGKLREYFWSVQYVHRDLAARNVLVTEDFTMKIADFGLARDVHNTDYYKMATNDLLPIKWMAYESLSRGIYTNQTDVWSYGVLFWEIMTLGDTPYKGIQIDNLFAMLGCGYRLEKPLHCSDDIYNVMCKCWSLEPSDRPNFSNIMKTLNEILTEVNDDFLMPELAQPNTPPTSEKSTDCNPEEIALPKPPLGNFNVDSLKKFNF